MVAKKALRRLQGLAPTKFKKAGKDALFLKNDLQINTYCSARMALIQVQKARE
jgi:hypothetical protein